MIRFSKIDISLIFHIFALQRIGTIILLLVSLQISNASPIQFWLNGDESFNQKEECSIYPVCFCQTIDPTDTLRLDIKDITDAANTLKVYKDDGSLWNTFNFASTGSDHHQYLLIIGANGDWNTVLDRRLIFKIYSGATLLAFSDCVEITSNDDFTCTKLISYSNSSDFGGINFPDFSPPATFYIRIPAVFFDEQYPQEQEDLELSSDEIITLWSKIEGKKLLDIGYMPFYMHLKLQMILMMDSVSIDGIYWRMRDPYQITPPSSKRSALRRAQVILSDRDFIDRNLL